ncbi:hypothetical protein [Mucilaginibacter terrae]|uniref:DUF4468 domain-containing protein n=1 Tax=Mucilaginibacter terrae TaxID=1955052 RepID=A0ABU3GQ92_9SPHI|nr:hypothetical protein [Mucilaginibacter terrae]MDT3401953.1 hypothetical protein [Mucilaginibacter terrae]
MKSPICITSKKFSFLFISMLLITSQLFAQVPPISRGSRALIQTDVPTDVAAIRQIYQQINMLKLKPQRFTYESPGCVEEGVVNYFFNDKTIVKITESGSIGDGSWVKEYYYNDGRVVFCLESIVGGPAIGPVTKTKYRYYVKNGRVIREMENDKVIPADSKATDILKIAGKIYKAYSTKKFAEAICN